MSENQDEPTLYTVSYLCSVTNQPRFINVSRPNIMPCHTPSWTEFLICPVCTFEFAANLRLPITLGCGHTMCKKCLVSIQKCPFDQTTVTQELDGMPINYALLQLATTSAGLNIADPEILPARVQSLGADDLQCYNLARKAIESLALNLKPRGRVAALFSRPMQRKIVTLINCQLVEDEGRTRLIRAARSLGERTVVELMLHHQNPNQLSGNLWSAVRARGCQFLGPEMQQEVLNLILVALEDGASISRKALVTFVVQKMETSFPHASKTNVGHVIQLLYRASCFVVTKRNDDSSLMQLQEEFRTYKSLRKEHDAQIVLIAFEAGLRIAPEQFSILLYGNLDHKSDMQSLIDKQQTPQLFGQSIEELMIALQRSGDPANLSALRTQMTNLAALEASSESTVTPSWKECSEAVEATKLLVNGFVDLVLNHSNRKSQNGTGYKVSMCRDLSLRGSCSRGAKCSFAHSDEELERNRLGMKKNGNRSQEKGQSSCSVKSVPNPDWSQGGSFNKSWSHQTPAKSSEHLITPTLLPEGSNRPTPNLLQNQMSLKGPLQPSSSLSNISNRFSYDRNNFGGAPIVTGYHNNYRTPLEPQQFRNQSRYSSEDRNPYLMSQEPLNSGNVGHLQADKPMKRNDCGFFGNSAKSNTSMMWRSGSQDKIENKSPNSLWPKSPPYSTNMSPRNRSELSELTLERMKMYRNQAADENPFASGTRTDQMIKVPALQFNTLQSLDSVPMSKTDEDHWFDNWPRTSVNYGAIGTTNQSAGSQVRPWNDTQSAVFKRFEDLGTSGPGEDSMAKMAPMRDSSSRMNMMSQGNFASRSWTCDMNQAQGSTAPSSSRPLFARQPKNNDWMERKQNWTEGSPKDSSFSSED